MVYVPEVVGKFAGLVAVGDSEFETHVAAAGIQTRGRGADNRLECSPGRACTGPTCDAEVIERNAQQAVP